MSRSGASGEGALARIADAGLVAFAAWTLACNATVVAGGGLRHALLAFVALAAAALAGALALRRRAGPIAPAPGPEAGASKSGPRPRTELLFLGAALLLVLGWSTLGEAATVPLWWASVLYLGAALVLALRTPTAPLASPVDAWWLTLAVLALALAAAWLPLVAHKPSTDDTYYVNVAAVAAADPGAPVLRDDTIHAIPGAPIMHAAYRVNSYELLGGAVAWLTPLTAIEACHWALSAAFGAFLVLAYARLLRLLAPRSWPWALLAAVLLLTLPADTHQSWGNFALVRMYQGKSALLSVFLPLVLAHGIRFARRPGLGPWLLLAAAQIAAIGASSTALWAAPIVAGLALVAGLPRLRGALRTLALGLLASTYVVGAALLVLRRSLVERDTDPEAVDGIRLVSNQAAPITEPDELARAAWEVVSGTGPMAALSLLVLLAGWLARRDGLVRRVGTLFPLGALLLLLNPHTALLVARYVTAESTYWRALWVVPLPALFALALTSPVESGSPGAPGSRLGRSLRLLAAAAMTALVVGVAPRVQGLSRANEVLWMPLIVKAPPQAYDPAAAVCEYVPAGSHVLAPKQVAAWIPTFEGAPHPLVSREHYLFLARPWLPPEELDLRLALFEVVSGVPRDDQAELLQRGVERFDLRAVTFFRQAVNADPLRRTLATAGFKPRHENALYETWVRGRRRR